MRGRVLMILSSNLAPNWLGTRPTQMDYKVAVCGFGSWLYTTPPKNVSLAGMLYLPEFILDRAWCLLCAVFILSHIQGAIYTGIHGNCSVSYERIKNGRDALAIAILRYREPSQYPFCFHINTYLAVTNIRFTLPREISGLCHCTHSIIVPTLLLCGVSLLPDDWLGTLCWRPGRSWTRFIYSKVNLSTSAIDDVAERLPFRHLWGRTGAWDCPKLLGVDPRPCIIII